jgi:putative transposase
VSDIYAAMAILVQSFPTAVVCKILDVSRSGFYQWQSSGPSQRQMTDAGLAMHIRQIFIRNKRRYGARRIASELADYGIVCGVRKVAKILKNQGLKALQPKSFQPKTTDSRHRLGYSPNLILDTPGPTRSNQLWVSDITYLPLRQGGFIYLAAIMDRYDRDIVGWAISDTMNEQLTLSALKQAIRLRQPGPGLILHSDRGGQYASHRYRAVMKRALMLQSMSRAECCSDNAFMESCWGTFKREIQIAEYVSREHAKKAMAEYIHYYRHERKHSALDYRTPHQFQKTTTPATC